MKTYKLTEILPPGLRAEYVPDPRFPGSQAAIVRNEYGREIMRCEATELTIEQWTAFFDHFKDLVSRKIWMDALTRAAGKTPAS